MYLISQKSLAAIAVRGNIPDIIGELLVAALEGHLELADGVQDGGVVTGKFLAMSGRDRLVSWRIRYMAI